MSKFIYDLLLLARLEYAKTEPNMEVADLSALIEDIAEYVEVSAAEQNIRIEASVAPKIFVPGSKDQLSESVVNLLSNAIKYMRADGERTVSIVLTANKQKAILTIKDSGIGIAKENLPHLFKRFYRAKNTEGRTTKGTGLGLAITKRIIENHGGTISVTSVLGQGTTFTISLPRKQPYPPA